MKGKIVKKLLSAFLVGAMAIGMLTGCGSTADGEGKANVGESEAEAETEAEGSTMVTESGLDISEEVNLVMYIISDRPAGQDVVDENLNKILKEKLNCTIDIRWLGWAEYESKYPTLFTSGEEFDLAYAAGWLNYSDMATKGAFMALDELWPQYAPKNWEANKAKEDIYVNGHYYGIPTLNVAIENFGPTYRTDLLDESEWDGVMETWEDMEEYLVAVKNKYPEMEPLDVNSEGMTADSLYMNSMGYAELIARNGLVYDLSSKEPKVELLSEVEWVDDYLTMISRWNELGLFSKTALSDTDTTKPQSGKAALSIHNIDNYKNMALNTDYEWAFSNYVKIPRYLGGGQDIVVLPNTCKNPERALAFWDLLTSDQEVYDAFHYGVEGVTYELNELGQYSILDSDLYATSGMWSAWNPALDRAPAGAPEDLKEMREQWEAEVVEMEANGTTPILQGFSIDKTAIENEIAMCADVYNQYWEPLSAGYTDVEVGLAEYAEKMEAAGIKKIQEEIQRQIDEYLASSN